MLPQQIKEVKKWQKKENASNAFIAKETRALIGVGTATENVHMKNPMITAAILN